MSENSNIPSVTARQAAHLSGLSETMVTYLSRIDVLKATGQTTSQRGKPRKFTFSDVLFLRVISDLLSKGIEVKRLGAALRRAKSDADEWLDIKRAPGRFLVTDGTELFLRKAGQLESKTFNGQLAFGFVIDLQEAHRTLSETWPVDIAAA